jgi:hypothetical protein
MDDRQLARGLAAFSIGLGLAELLAPRQVAQLAGIGEGHERLLQAMGLREITSGLGIMQGQPATFLWSRVAGDALDLALLAAAWRSDRSDRERLQYAIAAVAGVTVFDVLASVLQSRDFSEPGWRVADQEDYRAGIHRETPASSRAACDEAMATHARRDQPAREDRLRNDQPLLNPPIGRA